MVPRESTFIGDLVGTYADLEELMTLTTRPGRTAYEHVPLDAINDTIADLDRGRLQGRGILIPG